jgi:hypothetical protein
MRLLDFWNYDLKTVARKTVLRILTLTERSPPMGPVIHSSTQDQVQREMTLEEKCNDIRSEVKKIERYTRSLLNDNTYRNEQSFCGQHEEMKAQTMLAVRALEEARMRIGKVLQYSGDGVSIYDKV